MYECRLAHAFNGGSSGHSWFALAAASELQWLLGGPSWQDLYLAYHDGKPLPDAPAAVAPLWSDSYRGRAFSILSADQVDDAKDDAAVIDLTASSCVSGRP